MDFHSSSPRLPFLSLCSSRLSSHLLLIFCGLSFLHFLFCILLCSLLDGPSEAKQRIIIHSNAVEYIVRPNTGKVRLPAETSRPPNDGFPSPFVSVTGF